MKLPLLAKQEAKHILVFGPPKIGGKTWLVGKLAEAGFKLKWLDLESGRKTLYQLSPAAQEKIDVVVIPDSKSFPIAAQTVIQIFKGQKTRVCNTHGVIACAICMRKDPMDFSETHLLEMGLDEIIVIDSLTQLSNSIMSHIGKDKDDFWKPEWEHYRAQGAILDRLLSTIQVAPYHVIAITHEQAVPLEDGKERLVPVAGTSNFSRNTAKYFDEVVYCEVKNRRHIAASSTLYQQNILTGSRTGIKLEEDTSGDASLLGIFQAAPPRNEAATHLIAVKQEIKK